MLYSSEDLSRVVLARRLVKLARDFVSDDDSIEVERGDLLKGVGKGFKKRGRLLNRLDWDKVSSVGLDRNSKLKDMDLDQLRFLLTCVRGASV